jgi:hypothetical protein
VTISNILGSPFWNSLSALQQSWVADAIGSGALANVSRIGAAGAVAGRQGLGRADAGPLDETEPEQSTSGPGEPHALDETSGSGGAGAGLPVLLEGDKSVEPAEPAISLPGVELRRRRR